MINKKVKIGRNDPCYCGSDKKYKKCCLSKDRANFKDFDSRYSNTIEMDIDEKIRDNPSFKKMDQNFEGAKSFKNLVDMGILDGLSMYGANIDDISENLSKMVGMEKEFELITNMPDRFNEHFLKLGWIAHESMNFEEMKKAVELGDEEKFKEAEHGLIEYYSNNLELSIKMVQWIEEFKPRNELIQLAYDDYLAGRYHACIPVIFLIIDGVVADTKEIEGNKGFFAEDEGLYAWDSIAAHQTGLTELRKLLYKSRGTTNNDELEIPYRNGILHGRDLGYANKKVATKVWATLFALRDGIVAIKQKGKESREEDTDKFTFDDLIKNRNREQFLKEWKPRELKLNEDIPDSGKSSDYDIGSPERALVEFFENWQSNNFGKIAQMLDHRTLEEYTLNNLAGKLRRDIFNKKKLESYKILVVSDETPGVSGITAGLTIKNEDESIKKEVTFRLIYEDNNGKIEIRTMKNGSWRFISCFSEIGAI